MTLPQDAVQISIYLSEADEWHRKPLHLELLKYLREQRIAGATVLHAVAGFTGRGRVKTATLVDAGGKLPLVLTFVDTRAHIDLLLPTIKEITAQPLIEPPNVPTDA